MDYYSEIERLQRMSSVSANKAAQDLKMAYLAHVLTHFNITENDIKTVQSKVFVHKTVSDSMYETLRDYVDFFNKDQKEMFEKFMGEDLQNHADIVRFADMLADFAQDKPELERKLNCLFAVDGVGEEITYRNYVSNLKYEIVEKPQKPYDPMVYHLAAVRKLYKDKSVRPLDVHETLFRVINEEKGGLADLYRAVIRDVKYFVIDFVLKPRVEMESELAKEMEETATELDSISKQ